MLFDGREAVQPPSKPVTPRATADCVFDQLRAQSPVAYDLIPPGRWVDTARRKLRAHPYEIQRVATELKADLVVGGWLEKVEGGAAPYRLTMALYSNWADPLGQVQTNLPDRGCDPGALSPALLQLTGLIAQRLGISKPTVPAQPAPEADRPAPGSESPVSQAEDKEAAPITGEKPKGPLVPPNAEARELYYTRPPWRELFDLQAGYLFNWRRFTDNGSGTGFNVPAPDGSGGLAGAHGLLLHGELYPLTLLSGAHPAVTGLGMRFTAQLPFWPPVRQKNSAGAITGGYDASETRVEWGFLRWHYALVDALVRPELEVEALVGHHRFNITPGENVLISDLPSAGYTYVGGTVGARVHFARRANLRLGFTFAGMTDLGQLSLEGAPNNDPVAAGRNFRVYGPGSGWLWRGDLNVVVNLVRGLGLALGGFYERDTLSFEGRGDILVRDPSLPEGTDPPKVSEGLDQYGGFHVGLHYWY